LALQVALEAAKRDPGRESLFRLGFLYREVGRYRQALKILRDALRYEDGPRYILPEIHLHIAYCWFLLGKRKRMGEALKRAYALRPKPRTAFNFHLTLGTFYLARKRYSEAFEEYARAEAAAPSAFHRGRAAINQGVVRIRQGHLAEARKPLDRALGIQKRGGNWADLAITRTIRASVCFDEGQHRRALGMLLRAARSFRSFGKADREAEALVNAGYIAGEMGLWPRSRALLDRAIGIASETGQWNVLAPAYACRASVCASNEDFEEAAKNLAQSQRLLRGKRDWVGTLHVCRAQARLASILGRWAEVFKAARRAEKLAGKVGDTIRVVEFRRIRAAAEERLGRRKASVIARNSAQHLEGLLGHSSPAMRQITEDAERLAGTELPILLVGESGTGLVELAREIHGASPRAKRPCVVVPCEQLAFPSSDLQGHAEGAWSGASQASGGFAQQASGGTLVLDRVEHLSPEDQRALVRLVEGHIRPVGAPEEQSIKFRVVATCESPDRLIGDLRHRLEGAILRVPPLRARREDIPRMVEEQLAGRRRITPDAVAELARHRWAGNLPELSAAIHRLVALSEESIGRNLVRQVLTATESNRVARPVHIPRRSPQTALAPV
jgi:tetratricopeptide (TPR) repeat protein